jgi:hypothetical protein
MNSLDFFQRGVAFFPSNEPGIGDVLAVYGMDGERDIMHISPRSYLQQLSRFFGVDLTGMRARYGQTIAKRQMIPLPFAYNWTLVPFTVRIPIGKQQSYGWVVKQAIERVDYGEGEKSAHEDGLWLHLRGNHRIKILHTEVDFRRIMREAQLVELHYQLLHQTPDWVKETRSSYLHLFE